MGAVIDKELARLQENDEPFGAYLDRFGFELNYKRPEGIWPARVLKMGATLAWIAYRASGYTQIIDDDAFSTGTFLAELWGVPDAYTTSYFEDYRLQRLMRLVLHNAPDLQEVGTGYAQVLTLGAGSTRHYLQPAVLAA